ncbi:hypothetical protein D3C80_1412790 [compost metagenome]
MVEDGLQSIHQILPERLDLLIQRPYIAALEQRDQVLRALGKKIGNGFLVRTHNESLSVCVNASGHRLLNQCPGQPLVELAGGGQAGLELVAEGHQLVELGDDAVLFGEWRQRYGDTANFSDAQVEKSTCRDGKPLHVSHTNGRIQVQSKILNLLCNFRTNAHEAVLVDTISDLPPPDGTSTNLALTTVTLNDQEITGIQSPLFKLIQR